MSLPSFPPWLKNEPREQIDGIVSARSSPCAIIVCGRPVESQISCILQRKVEVLRRPPRNIGNVSAASWVAAGAAGHRRRCIEQWIGRARDIEPAKRARIAVAKVIFRVRLHGVQVMADQCRTTESKRSIERRIFANVGAAE